MTRVRLDFDGTLPVGEPLQRSWLVLPDGLQCLGDLYGHILREYSLRKRVPEGPVSYTHLTLPTILLV